MEEEEGVQTVLIGGVAVESKPQRRRQKPNTWSDNAAIPLANVAADSAAAGGAEAVESEDFSFTPELQFSLVPRDDHSSIPTTTAAQAMGNSSSCGFEYQDHTADIIVHAVARSLKGVLSFLSFGLFNYMTDLASVEPRCCCPLTARGTDLSGLLFDFLNEMHALYGEQYFIGCSIKGLRIYRGTDPAGAEENQLREFLFATCQVYGEVFDSRKHSQGTEIKAVTMHQMRLLLTQQQEHRKQHQRADDEWVVLEDLASLSNIEALSTALQDESKRIEAYVVLDI
ncbi:uncharacterized protein LOC34619127 [Cyclospora cayetanensis]|uniref:Uncharacterized protein LOC34619127 n=2 Tax=Cyclospora cayetanensis TaxID=88456 RepID=A0A6P5WDB8_9EIME|nr:uncharacterized protein LOC34619127 [Cyclospora cayetanensis]OEH77193.1 hypothetical protein cyc_02248 [Cyclospora cayetanensis]